MDQTILLDSIVFYLIQGAIWILLIYNLALYFMAQRKFNLSYAAYLLFVSLNFINVKFHLFSEYYSLVQPESYRLKFETYYVEAWMYISYFYFIRHYIESKSDYPDIDRLLKVMIANSSFEVFITNLLLTTGHYDSLYIIVNGLKIVNMLCAIGLVPLFYRHYNRLIKYLFFGGTSLLIATILYFTTFNLGIAEGAYWQPYYFIYLGIFIEIVVFSLGIGYRMKLAQDEKINVQNALIETLKSREAYEQKLNRDMLEKLREREAEIKSNTEEIYEAKLARELSESKMKLFTTRMNPHFIFNSLNSLKYLIIKNEDAIPYIDKFSALLRNILIQSDTTVISLKDELVTLEHYIDLEKLRFSDSFGYSINVQEGLSVSEIFLPPLLLQPLVENAIHHGLRPLQDRERRLSISLRREARYLKIVVEDNGIGRPKRSGVTKSHKSLGLELINNRLAIYDLQNEGQSSLDLIDKIDKSGNSLGTKVIVSLDLNHLSI